tara:strand:- start:755 stop:1198 length:444 start_codon:yes stop_codon:yes gene_type:complete
MRLKITDDILEIILFGLIMVTLGLVFFQSDEPTKVQTEPDIASFSDFPLQAWQTTDLHGGDCIKIRYMVTRPNTRLFMINADGKRVHMQPISLSPRRSEDRIETYVWKLYRTEWTDKISPGEYLIVVGTDHDRRAAHPNLSIKVDVM